MNTILIYRESNPTQVFTKIVFSSRDGRALESALLKTLKLENLSKHTLNLATVEEVLVELKKDKTNTKAINALSVVQTTLISHPDFVIFCEVI